MRFILEQISSPQIRTVAGLYLITLFGTLVMHVFQMNKGFNGSAEFLRGVFPDRSPVFYTRVDLVVVSFVGSLVGMIVFSPQSAISALAAGCGWVGALNTLIATTPPVRVAKATTEKKAEES